WTKREFGKALIEQVLPGYRLNLVVDTSGAYIPGHGTPTLLLFGQYAKPTGAPVRTVQGKRGEPSTPDDPEQGHVWSSIRDRRRGVGHEGDYFSAAETPAITFAKHPWSLGGGGASALKEHLESIGVARLGELCDAIGFGGVTREDEAYLIGCDAARRARIPEEYVRPLVEGDTVRDWSISGAVDAIWPYCRETLKA